MEENVKNEFDEKPLVKSISVLSLTSMGIGVVTWELGKIIVKTVKMAITGRMD